jgi:hypothetical protein
MNWGNLAIAAVVSIAMIASYLWGYRDGVKYCARQMGPLAEEAKKIADALRNRGRKP